AITLEDSKFNLFWNNKIFSKPIAIICPTFMINKITIVGKIVGMLIYQIRCHLVAPSTTAASCNCGSTPDNAARSEEHTSELQSRFELVCRLLLEKKKTKEY